MDSSEANWPPRKLAWSWVFALILAYMCSLADRQVLAMMVDPIRADLHISDSEFGLLHGLSFALLYCLVGLPAGTLIDRYPRRVIIASGIALWTVMTALCGTSRYFWQLFLARIGVGLGEGTLSPSAYSLLADCFPKERLGRAMSLYISGAAIGTGAAMMIGGSLISHLNAIGPVTLPLLGEFKPWQMVFLIVCLPGLPVAALVWSLREPPRQGQKQTDLPSWGAVMSFLIARRKFVVPLLLAFGSIITVSLATMVWAPTFLMRAYGKTAAEVGLPLGPLTTIAMSAGPIGGAWVAERLAGARGIQHAALRVAVIGMALGVTAAFAMLMSTSFAMGLAATFLVLLLGTAPVATASAALLTLTPSAMRGRVSAIVLVVQNVIAMVLGPLVPALLTDHLFMDDKKVGLSLALTDMVSCIAGAALFLLALRNLNGAATAREEPALSGAAG